MNGHAKTPDAALSTFFGQQRRMSRDVRRQLQREQVARARQADHNVATVEALLGDECTLEPWQRERVRELYAQRPDEAERARLRALFGTA
jgi:hypothetical protein